MLFTEEEKDSFVKWNEGKASYFLDDIKGKPMVNVRCKLANSISFELALLDTGAEWTVLALETVEDFLDVMDGPLESKNISTRFGLKEGHFYRMPITLLADENMGNNVEVNSTVLIVNDWPGPSILGYRGFMERLRIALDPGVYANDAMFYFGLPQ